MTAVAKQVKVMQCFLTKCSLYVFVSERECDECTTIASLQILHNQFSGSQTYGTVAVKILCGFCEHSLCVFPQLTDR